LEALVSKENIEIWDADNHMYETIDAYTRYLPEKYAEALKFVDVNGRKKLQILGTVTECIPNPTYEVIPTPGAITTAGSTRRARRCVSLPNQSAALTNSGGPTFGSL
jgi:DNA modification methylase